MRAYRTFYFGRFILLGIGFLALFTYVVMLLWNWLVPEVFNGPVLGYWQTLGILVLSKILFTGLGMRHRPVSHWKYRSWEHGHSREYWRKRFEEKMHGKSAPKAADQEAESPGSGG